MSIAGGMTRIDSQPHWPPPPANGNATIRRFGLAFGTNAVRGFTTGRSGTLGMKKDRADLRINLLPLQPMGHPPQAHEIDAYYVPMVQTFDVLQGASHYLLPAVQQPGTDLMFTSQLSGCSFGIGSDANGARLVSHVQPYIAVPREARAAHLDAAVNAGFPDNQPAPTIWRHENYGERAAIIGRWHGDSWRFYMQSVHRIDINRLSIDRVTVVE